MLQHNSGQCFSPSAVSAIMLQLYWRNASLAIHQNVVLERCTDLFCDIFPSSLLGKSSRFESPLLSDLLSTNRNCGCFVIASDAVEGNTGTAYSMADFLTLEMHGKVNIR